ncbi:Endonuclease G [Blattella germanica]|nr:Endonuclease G [Blattella germanica]
MAWKATLQISTITGVGIAGLFAGIATEKWKQTSNKCKCECVSRIHENPLQHIKRLPGLPIFGTVSAATVIDKKPALSNEISTVESTPIQSSASRVSEIMRFGFPGFDTIRSFDDYVLSYDKRTRVPHWVFEHLTKESLAYNESVDRSKCESLNSDYKRSGFDRGHMAAAGNHRKCQKDVDQTFLLSNMAPQVGVGFNRHSWNRLEKYVRKMTKSYKNVYVCTGPLYLPRKEDDGKMYVKYQVIGASTVAVPTHFFKVVVGETDDNKLDMEAYVPPESIERAAGLLFFDKVSRDKLRKINGRKSTWV